MLTCSFCRYYFAEYCMRRDCETQPSATGCRLFERIDYNDDTRPFPIQGGDGCRDEAGGVCYTKSSTIPWWLAEEAYRHYSKRFGVSQSLERIAERGGFGREELLLLLRQEA
jgi:hypothetical protein